LPSTYAIRFLLRGEQIQQRSFHDLGLVLQSADAGVAVVAEQPAKAAGDVVVIYHQSLARRRLLAAHRACVALRVHQLEELVTRHSVEPMEPPKPHVARTAEARGSCFAVRVTFGWVLPDVRPVLRMLDQPALLVARLTESVCLVLPLWVAGRPALFTRPTLPLVLPLSYKAFCHEAEGYSSTKWRC
jgi:hypothetical protein